MGVFLKSLHCKSKTNSDHYYQPKLPYCKVLSTTIQTYSNTGSLQQHQLNSYDKTTSQLSCVIPVILLPQN